MIPSLEKAKTDLASIRQEVAAMQRIVENAVFLAGRLWNGGNSLGDLKRLVKEIFGVHAVTLTNGDIVDL
jgi:hypothetical protein